MPRLSVKLSARSTKSVVPGEFSVTAVFTNEGEESAPLNLSQAEHPALVLQVRDRDDQCLLLPPPHAPDEDEHIAELKPGESLELTYAGFLDRDLPAGTYRVRYFSRFAPLGADETGAVASEWLEFTVATVRPGFTRGTPLQPFRTGVAHDALVRDFVVVVLIRCFLRRWWCLLQRIIDAIFALFTGRRRRCQRVLEQEIDVQRTETISDAPPGSEAWNGTYSWRARFHVRVDEPACRVTVTIRIRITGTITNAQRAAWENAIQAKWNDRFKLCCSGCCCIDGFPLVLDIVFVTSNEHQVVNAAGSTTNMTNWGATDTVDVGHEVGHMLGALDEYFTVNGVNYGPGRQATGNIMNNPANDPVAHHYDLVRAAAEQLRGSACETTPIGRICC